MSRSIDLFIDSDRPIEDLAAQVQRLTGMQLRAAPDASSWQLEEGGVHALLRRHGCPGDGDLLLERYPYSLGALVAGGTRLVDAAETALLRLVAEAFQREGVATLLVHDLQYRGASPPEGPAPGTPAPATPVPATPVPA